MLEGSLDLRPDY